MPYEIGWEDKADQAFQKLDKAIQRQVKRVVDRLAENPRPGQATPLVGDPSTLRVRAGDWRILYEVHHDQRKIVILGVRHRSRAYS